MNLGATREPEKRPSFATTATHPLLQASTPATRVTRRILARNRLCPLDPQRDRAARRLVVQRHRNDRDAAALGIDAVALVRLVGLAARGIGFPRVDRRQRLRVEEELARV